MAVTPNGSAVVRSPRSYEYSSFYYFLIQSFRLTFPCTFKILRFVVTRREDSTDLKYFHLHRISSLSKYPLDRE